MEMSYMAGICAREGQGAISAHKKTPMKGVKQRLVSVLLYRFPWYCIFLVSNDGLPAVATRQTAVLSRCHSKQGCSSINRQLLNEPFKKSERNFRISLCFFTANSVNAVYLSWASGAPAPRRLFNPYSLLVFP
ncbi:hypothetical protein [Nissabacter sp. SGAir0207]|uniref:hypothetical protein n=1 Tax=Nissabacter sp. SGAir0207 TaxID=2126321 RepID=UPI00143CD93A|nr:hypothetical protein [Nissabacter sp. SGAir0207]